MKRGLGFKLVTALLIYANLLPPALLLAQTSKPAGVVSALKGEVVITRVALPQQPVPLKFKDEVFFRDRITTKEQSLVRVLMGGKALITVRELSELTITEEPGKPSLVDLARGKIGLAVARAKMSPGESIEVRTPNAVAAVRGTVIVVEVISAAGPAADAPDYQPVRASFTGQASPVQAPSFITNFHVIKGSIDITSLAKPGAPPVTIGAGLSLSVTGAGIGQPRPSPPSQQLVKDLKAEPQHTGTPSETNQTIAGNQLNTATGLAGTFFPPAPTPLPPPPTPKPPDAIDPCKLDPNSDGCKVANAVAASSNPQIAGPIAAAGLAAGLPASVIIANINNFAVCATCPNSPIVIIDTSSFLQNLDVPLGRVTAGATTEILSPANPGPANPLILSNLTTSPGTVLDATAAAGEVVALPSGIGLIDTDVNGEGGEIFSVDGAAATIHGSALALIRSSITGFTTILDVFEGSLAGTSTGALITLADNSSIQAGRLVSVDGESSDAFLGTIGPVLAAADSSVTLTGDLIFVGSGGMLESASLPLVALANSTLQASSLLTIFVGELDGEGNVIKGVELGGSALLAQNGSDVSIDLSVIHVGDGGILTTSSSPAISLQNSSLSAPQLLVVDDGCGPGGSVTLGGSLLSATDSQVETFVVVGVLSGQLTASSAQPLISLANSTLDVIEGGWIFRLFGGATASELVEGVSLTLGTDRPLRGPDDGEGGFLPLQAPLLSASASSISAKQLLRLDTALLETVAPLVDLLNSPETLVSASDLVHLVSQAKLVGTVSGDALVKLDGSSLIVTSGALFNVAGGSFLHVPSGSLFSLTNNSMLNILSGPLVTVSGGSVFKLENGSLGTFGTGTNTLNLGSAPLCSSGTCVPLLGTGFNILLVNSASLGNVLIDPTFTTFAGLGGSNTITGLDSTKALLVLDGPLSTLALGLAPVPAGAPAGNPPLVTLTNYTGGDSLTLSDPLGQIASDVVTTQPTPQSFTAPDPVPATPYFATDDGSGIVLSGGIGITNSSINATGNKVFEVQDGVSASIDGSALTLTSSSITNAGIFLDVSEFGGLTGLSTAPLISLASSSSLDGSRLAEIRDNLTVAGPLLSASNSSINLSNAALNVADSDFGGALVVTTTASQPLIFLDNSTFQASVLLDVGSGGSVELAGPLLSATNNSALQISGNGVLICCSGVTLTTTTSTAPLIALANSHATFSGSVLGEVGGVDVTLAGSLLSVGGRPMPAATSLTADSIVEVNGFDTSLTVGGSILSVTNTALAPGVMDISLSGTAINVSGNLVSSNLLMTSTAPAISLQGSSLLIGGSLLNVAGSSTVAVAGPLLAATTSLISSEAVSVGATNTVSTGGCCPVAIALTPNGLTAYVANGGDFGDSTVGVFDTLSNTLTATVDLSGVDAGDGFPVGVAVTPDGSRVFVAHGGGDGCSTCSTVSIINTATNTVTGTVTVGQGPRNIAFTPNGAFAYVTNQFDDTVSVIDTSTNSVIATVPVGIRPFGVAVTPDGTRAYVVNQVNNTVSVIDTATNLVVGSPIPVGSRPFQIVITPDGQKAYVANKNSNTVSVINTATNLVVATVGVGVGPRGLGISPGGSRLYVTNQGSDSVSVINTSTNTVVDTVLVGNSPNGVAVAVVADGTQRAFIVNEFGQSLSVVGLSGSNNLVLVASGGSLTTDSALPLVDLQSSTLSVGGALFDLSGSATMLETIAVDFSSTTVDLTLGTDRPLRGPGATGCPNCLTGPILNATNATVTTNQAVKIDTALLEASAPLIQLMAASTMTSNSDLFNLANQAKMFANLLPSDAIIRLDNSILNVTNGSLFNVAGGSYLNVVGNLFSLTNNSTLNITNGALVALSGGSVFSLTGSFGSFGAGANALNLPTTLAGYTVDTSLGFGVALATSVASITQVAVQNFTPFTGLGGSNTVTANGIVVKIADAASKVRLCTSVC